MTVLHLVLSSGLRYRALSVPASAQSQQREDPVRASILVGRGVLSLWRGKGLVSHGRDK
jgi:hypothetical protein